MPPTRARTALKQAEATLKADTAENEREKEHARQQTAEDQKQLAELSDQRQQLRSGVDEEALTHYDRVLKLRGSVMAAVYEDESCSACRVRLRPQVFQDVTTNQQFVTCFYCNRILVLRSASAQGRRSQGWQGARRCGLAGRRSGAGG